ncbi:PaaI family thioesterase [Sphingomonas cannabina]|uniref:PaaI family thioesterase n=1 Tax=Sphingomonas cannabina TaxID=2899123 RepID=UPI001F35E1BB|nr:PaaI family thioesterase [Sphingomonas cannabina]UIJ45624.1 PaaI family thioesterase [Sphingomonas cannabina]
MRLPPYADLLGLSIEAGEGSPVLVMPFDEVRLSGRPGFLHGGAIGGLLEMAAIVALHHALGDDGTRIKPVNLTVDYMRGGRAKATRAQGIIRRLGTRIANVDATAWQDDPDKPIAAARQTFLLVRPSSPASA